MHTKRIVPCLDVRDGKVVKGINFVGVKEVGDPVQLGEFYYKQGADEVRSSYPSVLAKLHFHLHKSAALSSYSVSTFLFYQSKLPKHTPGFPLPSVLL